MVYYDFEDVETGEHVELDMPMSEAVDFGAVIERDGRKLRRLFDASGARFSTGPNYPFKVYSQHPDTDGALHHDKDGAIVITSSDDIRRIHRKTGLTYDWLSDCK